MGADTQERDEEQLRRERESFIVLQHVHTMSTAEPGRAIPFAAVCVSLGYVDKGSCRKLVEHLVGLGFLAYAGAGSLLSITPRGIDHLERRARHEG